jgi:Protein of unknown function (DUF1559)
MPRRDDEFDDDERPRPRRRDDDDDRPSRSQRRPSDEDDRPRRRSRDDDDYDRAPPRKKSNLGLILGIIVGVLILVCGGGGVGLYFAFRGAVTKVTDTADRMSSNNNLKQITLANMNYLDKYNDFPNNSYGPDGKPLLSWRVHLLPFVEEQGLYRQFKLDEPWDSANNRRLLDQMPLTYATPTERTGRTPRGNKTYYRGFSGPGGIFARRDQPPAEGMKLGFDQPLFQRRLKQTDITDGFTNTIFVVEAGDPVEWTKPDDLDASPGKPFPPLGGIRPKDDIIQVGFLDGSVRPVKRTNTEAQWRAAITIAGRETITLD